MEKSDESGFQKVDSRLIISLLWVAVMFIYVYADIQTFFQKGMISQISTGKVAGMEINQLFLLSSAVLMSIPGFMIFLSLIMKPRINKLVNIIVSTLHIALIVMLQFMPAEKWIYYIYFNIIEVVFHLFIVLYSFKITHKNTQIASMIHPVTGSI